MLRAWDGSLKGYYPFDKIFKTVEDAMLDGVLDEEEKRVLLVEKGATIAKSVTAKLDVFILGEAGSSLSEKD